MLTFDSIRIRNFRAIKELTFQPKTEGITGIFGANGQGKTSILIAVVFALYGSLPKGVPTSALRHIGSGAAECSVSVVFTHLNQKVEVIRELKGANNRVVVNIYVNGKAETVTSVGAADKWMQKRFGIDSEGFLTAFVIRQKELDAFVKAVPSERKQIIEKLAGVDTINKALKAARESEKDSRKTVDLLPGSAESVENAGAEIDFYTEQQRIAEDELMVVKEKLSALQATRVRNEQQLAELKDKENNLFRIDTRITSLQGELTSIDGQLERVLYTETVAEGETAESLRASYRTLTEQINGLRSEAASLEHQKLTAENRVSQLTTQIVSDEATLIAAKASAPSSKKEDVEAELATTEPRVNELLLDIDRLETSSNDLAISIDALKHSAECPTCHTELKDPESLLEQFRNIISANEEKTIVLNKEVADVRQAIRGLKESVQIFTRIEMLETSLDETKTALEKAQSTLSELPSVDALQTQISTLIGKQEAIAETGRKAKTLEDDREQFTTLTERKLKLNNELKLLRDDSSLIELNFNRVDIQKLTTALSQTQTQFDNLSNKNAELTGQTREAAIRFETSRKNYQRLYEQWERKRGLMDAHAKKTLTTDMLERFRQETVSSIAPELSDYATSLISDMTNGEFVEIRLDDDFKASVITAGGDERQVSWLSGGEESAVALALRLATAFLITGGSSELLWLDEPLTAQDADRRAAILSLLRKLPIKQIILINHAQEAQDIVDYEITLGKEPTVSEDQQ